MKKTKTTRLTDRQVNAAFEATYDTIVATPGPNMDGELYDQYQDWREEMIERGLLRPVTFPADAKLRYSRRPPRKRR